MANLSSHAQAVLDAAKFYKNSEKAHLLEAQIAAALRATADIPYFDAGDLVRIADELELRIAGNPNIFRDLCAELVQAWDDTYGLGYEYFGIAASYLIDRARDALAQEQPEVEHD